MIHEEPIGIIELGSVNLKCLIFKIDKDNNSEILSTSITQSEGINNDAIVNLSKASNAIRLAISSAEKKAKISLKKINIVLEQNDFLCTKFSKHKKIDGSKIYRHDIEFLLKEAKKQLIFNDKNQSIIHIFNHSYIVDEKIFLEEPINVFADSLSHEMTFITVPKNNLRNINQAFIDCDIEIDRLISKTFSLGANLLNFKELETGCGLINLEKGRVSLGLFKNLALVHSITLPLGADHISKDISKVCSLSVEEAKKIRNKINFSFQNQDDLFDENNFLKDIYFETSNYRKISKELILNVAKSRLDEIFEMLKKQMIVPDFSINSVNNFLLLEEDDLSLNNLDKYLVNNFNSRIIKKNQSNLGNSNSQLNNFSASLGALKIIKDGWETEAIPELNDKNLRKISFLGNLFEKIWKS